ncbi:MAG: aminotransferase class III-fold pyridoxal phosphate-dependent enzyme, partial [Gammaproteobacteria bacterium]|nr:aminotransferase class III-fold pyridoxal phosphate-dependent enzyme [Gammaproteobacteria bacterium]
GFGRTGNMWGSQTYDLTPDIVTCAKQLSSAYLPIAAVMISEDIYRAFVEQSKKHGALGMGYTYGGHPVSAAVALETLNIYEERDILSHVRSVAPRFQQRLHDLGAHPLVGEARGVGLIGGLEIVADKASKALFDPGVKSAAKVFEHTLQHGLFVRPLPSDTVGICPPLIITEQEVDMVFDRLQQGLDDAAKTLSAE